MEVGMSDEFLCFLFVFLNLSLLSYSLLPAALPSTLSNSLFLSPSLLSLFMFLLFISLHVHTEPSQSLTAGYGRKLLAAKEAQL